MREAFDKAYLLFERLADVCGMLSMRNASWILIFFLISSSNRNEMFETATFVIDARVQVIKSISQY